MNLLSEKKSGENSLAKEFETMAVEYIAKEEEKRLESEGDDDVARLEYEFLDFHKVCAGKKLQNLQPRIDKLTPKLREFGFFAKDSATNQVIMR